MNLFLEFHVDFVQNRPKNISLGYSRMLYTNITTLRVSEAHGTKAENLLLEFHVDFVQNRSKVVTRGVFEHD